MDEPTPGGIRHVPHRKEQEQMFVGTHINGVDAKGRTSVPAVFRAALSGARTVFVWPSFPSPCLEGGGQALLESYARRLDNGGGGELREDFEHAIFGDAHMLDFDQTGRMVLPEALRMHAGLAEQAAFVGLGPRFEIWNPARLEQRRAEARERAGQRRALLHAGAGS
jgi:MraZ protein